MYNEQLESLINAALTDGVLTEKEKQILFKKAEEFGVDLDEFEMVLGAKLFEKQNTSKQSTAVPKSDKLGDVKKCPACGAIISSFTSSCAECGFEFRNVGVNNSVKLLSEKLENILIECDNKDRNGEYRNGGIKALTETPEMIQAKKECDIADKQQSVIKNFPIPNTRDDILELLHFILPKIKLGFSSDKNVSAWRFKFTEIINRAKIAFKDDKKMLAEINDYEAQLKGSMFSKAISWFGSLDKETRKKVIVFGVIGIFVLISIFFFKGMGADHDKAVAKEKERLEAQLVKVNDAIRATNYDLALTLCVDLQWEYTDDYSTTDTKELKATWEVKKEELVSHINDLQSSKHKKHSIK